MFDLNRWFEMKHSGQPIAAITSYDTPTTQAIDAAGVDMILVGDSVGMAVLGYETTTRVSMEDMTHHVRAVAQAKPRAPVVADMPFLSYGVTISETIQHAHALLLAGAQAVKCEGGRKIAEHIRALVDNGVPVVGHIGLSPQKILQLGTYRVTGSSREEADGVMEDARILDELGVAAIVLECVPEKLGAEITKAVRAPTVGIGAGRFTDGQIIVIHDILGMVDPGMPLQRFVRRYAEMYPQVVSAVKRYAADVRRREFPSAKNVYAAMDAAAGAIYATSGNGLPVSTGAAATPVRARTIPELKAALAARRVNGPVGFVPTMGALHAGHVSLVERARAGCATVVASIYVNPTQFGPTEDLSKYPRDLEGDIAKLASAGCDIVFFPDDAVMYPAGEMTRVTVNGSITEGLCGRSRPGHFTGVATIVLKLLNLVKPDRAYFGEKDAQQLRVIRRMAADLFLETEIVGCPIIREGDGLAMSSRNVYLTPEERKTAPELYRILCDAKSLIETGERDPGNVETFMARRIEALKIAELDYASAVDGATLARPEKLSGDILLLVAARFGKARLIDNMQVVVPEAKR